LNFRNELFDLAASSSTYSSVLGKTQGALAPNEFWYFWRRFFPFGEIQRLEPEVLARVDDRGFLAELAAIESVQDKPFAAKGMILNWNLTYLDALLPKALFLHVVRDPLMTAQSLLEARQKFFGRMDAWYSF